MTLHIFVGVFICACIFKGGSDITITVPPTEPEKVLGVPLHLVSVISVFLPSVQPTPLFGFIPHLHPVVCVRS